jgi:hypothetical protein
MHSHYAHEATSYANMQLSVHERIDDLHKRAYGLAPSVAESAADSGCTDGPGTSRRIRGILGERQLRAWNMIAEALGWNAISDSPAMLAEAERREAAGEPYYVGYENTKPAEFTTALATETNVFEFGVWGPDQPLEVLPADNAREMAETNALIDEISERHGLSTEPASPLLCSCGASGFHLCNRAERRTQPTEAEAEAEELTSANAQPCPSMHPGMPGLTCNLAGGHSANHYALGYTWTNLRTVHEDVAGAHNSARCTTCGRNAHRPDSPWQGHPYTAPATLTAQLVLTCCGTEVNYPQAGGETACTVCHTTFTVTAACPDELVSCEECSAPCDGTLTAWSELFEEDVPVCPDCHRMCQLMDAVAVPVPSDPSSDPAYAIDFRYGYALARDDLKAGQRGRREFNNTPAGIRNGYERAWAEATESSARHAGELWDIPTSYAGRHRCSVI